MEVQLELSLVTVGNGCPSHYTVRVEDENYVSTEERQL